MDRAVLLRRRHGRLIGHRALQGVLQRQATLFVHGRRCSSWHGREGCARHRLLQGALQGETAGGVLRLHRRPALRGGPRSILQSILRRIRLQLQRELELELLVLLPALDPLIVLEETLERPRAP